MARADKETKFVVDDSLLTDGQKKRLKKIDNRINTNRDEQEKWKEVLQSEQSQDMKKILYFTNEIVEAIANRGTYLSQKKEEIIAQINLEHKGGSSSAAKTLMGEADEDELVPPNAGEEKDESAIETGNISESKAVAKKSKHLDQTVDYVGFKEKNRKLIMANGSKVKLGKGDKIKLDDNTHDEVLDFIQGMNLKFPALDLKPDDIYFRDGDETRDRLNSLLTPQVETTNLEDDYSDKEIQEFDDIIRKHSEENSADMSEQEFEDLNLSIRFVGVVLTDEQQLLISGLDKENFEEILASDRFKEVFPPNRFEVIREDDEGADIVIEALDEDEEEDEDSESTNTSLSLEEALNFK